MCAATIRLIHSSHYKTHFTCVAYICGVPITCIVNVLTRKVHLMSLS